MRGDKRSLDIDEFDQVAEAETTALKTAYSGLVKRLNEVHPYDEDMKKARKRVAQHELGCRMMQEGMV